MSTGALARIQSVLGLRTLDEARQFCDDVRRLGKLGYSNQEIADWIDKNWEPGFDARSMVQILGRDTQGEKSRKSTSPKQIPVPVRHIANELGISIGQAEYIYEEIRSHSNKPIPLAYIDKAAQEIRKNGKIPPNADLSKLARELFLKARDEMLEREYQATKRKDAKVRNMAPLPKQDLPDHVIDESGFIIKNPRLSGDEK